MIIQNNFIDGTFSIDYCVNSVLADLELPESKKYLQFLKFGVDAFRRLNLAGIMPTVKTKRLEIDPFTHTARIPNDFVRLNKLGVMCGGHLINFDIDYSLALKSPNQIDTCPCSPQEIKRQMEEMCCRGEGNNQASSTTPPTAQQQYFDTDAALSWYYPFYSRWHNGQYTAGFFGMGAGFRRGGYLTNTEANIFQFDPCLHIDEVVLEYISTGIDESGNAIIPQNAIEAICAFIHERNCAVSKDQATKQMTAYWNRKWVAAATSMVKREQALSYDEWVLLFRTYTYQIPKR